MKMDLEWFELQQKIQQKISEQKNNLSGMTVNERLYVTNLMSEFDYYLPTNKKIARFILENLNVDEVSIQRILD